MIPLALEDSSPLLEARDDAKVVDDAEGSPWLYADDVHELFP